MTNKTFRILLKAIAAFAITAAFGSATFAGDFTVREGKRYCATLSLNSVERLADNALIAKKFRALGFSRVHVNFGNADDDYDQMEIIRTACALLRESARR